MIRRKLFLVIIILSGSFFAQAQTLMNQPAPVLDFEAILPAGKNTDITQLEGRYVLLEFWATWCTPCVRNIPHLNELAGNFKEVQFVSITDEPREKIEKFLQSREIKGWVAIDKDGATFRNYHVEGRPQTFIIDKKGMVIFEGDPSHVTEQLLSKIVSGSYLQSQPVIQKTTGILGSWGGGQDPVITGNFGMDTMNYLHHEVVRKSVNPYSGSGWMQNNGEAGITLLGMNLSEIIATTSGLPSALRVQNRSAKGDNERWDIIFSRKKGYDLEKGMKTVSELVCNTFSVEVRDELIAKDALIPVYPSENKLIKVTAVKDDDPNLRTYQLLSDIFQAIEKKTGMIVDYKDDAGNFFVDVFSLGSKYYSMTGEELEQWLQKGYGIGFRTENRNINMKVITDE